MRYGDPRWGQAQRCTCFEASLTRERDRQAAQVRDGILNQLHTDMGKLRACSFDNFNLQRPLADVKWKGHHYPVETQRAALTRALARLKSSAGLESFFLSGSYGSGKSHLAAAVVNAAAQQGRAACYVTAMKLLKTVQSGFSDNTSGEKLQALIDAEILVLDELGSENLTDWSDSVLFDVIDSRGERPTIVTSNLDLEARPGQIGQRYPRVASRLSAYYQIEIITSDIRKRE